MSEGLEASLPSAGFRGSLDLLIHLVKIKTLALDQVLVSELIEGYLSIVEQLNDAELKAEYLLVTTTLVVWRAKLALGMDIIELKTEELQIPDTKEEPIEPTKYQVLPELANLHTFLESVPKLGSDWILVNNRIKDNNLEIALSNDGFEKQAYEKICKQKPILVVSLGQLVNALAGLKHQTLAIKRQPVNLSDKINELRTMIANASDQKLSFKALTTSDKLNNVVLFLAVLELVKNSEITIELAEDENFTVKGSLRTHRYRTCVEL